MGHIPDDAEWFVAVLLMEITVEGATRNVVHRNLTLISATTAEAAYTKALEWGKKGESTYGNQAGQRVEIKFRGIAELDVVIDPLEDGAELFFSESVGVQPEEIETSIPPKELLQAFRKPSLLKTYDPDYRSKQILDQVAQMLVEDGQDPDPQS